MKTVETKYHKIKNAIRELEYLLHDMERKKEAKESELKEYVRRHRSLKFKDLIVDDGKLKKIYAYFDALYPIKWQGGVRCCDNCMSISCWVDDDPDYLILHLSSENICFDGSTSWIVKAETLADKVKVLTKVKKDLQKIVNVYRKESAK